MRSAIQALALFGLASAVFAVPAARSETGHKSRQGSRSNTSPAPAPFLYVHVACPSTRRASTEVPDFLCPSVMSNMCLGLADANSYFAGQQAAIDVRELEDFAHEHQDQVCSRSQRPDALLGLTFDVPCAVADGPRWPPV